MGKRNWREAFAAGSAPIIVAPNLFNVLPEQAARKVAKATAKAEKAKAKEAEGASTSKQNRKEKRALRMKAAKDLLLAAQPHLFKENFEEGIAGEEKAKRGKERKEKLALLAGKEEKKNEFIVSTWLAAAEAAAAAKAKEAEGASTSKPNRKEKRALRMGVAKNLLLAAQPHLFKENFEEGIAGEEKEKRGKERKEKLALLAGKEGKKDEFIVSTWLKAAAEEAEAAAMTLDFATEQ